MTSLNYCEGIVGFTNQMHTGAGVNPLESSLLMSILLLSSSAPSVRLDEQHETPVIPVAKGAIGPKIVTQFCH